MVSQKEHLEIIRANPGIRQTELLKLLGCSPNGYTIRQLAKKRLIKKVPHKGGFALYPTDEETQPMECHDTHQDRVNTK